jgi:hypothetical protein
MTLHAAVFFISRCDSAFIVFPNLESAFRRTPEPFQLYGFNGENPLSFQRSRSLFRPYDVPFVEKVEPEAKRSNR